ncbi:MAG: hypothetical protein OQJ80_12980 [Kangiella sp.]|jgi:hypothetical protein|nr:hypothetical protein [Kangiella sp.]
MSNKTLEHFLIQLSEDSHLYQNYCIDPVTTMKEAGLSNREVEILSSNDKSAIDEVIGDKTNCITIIKMFSEGLAARG